MATIEKDVEPQDPTLAAPPAPSFWREVWHRFRKSRRAMAALSVLLLLASVALLAPCIVGSKPIVCRYKGGLYFPFLGHYRASLENPVFAHDDFENSYPANLKKKDPASWAVWPIFFADPEGRVRARDWSFSEGTGRKKTLVAIPGWESKVEPKNGMAPCWAAPFGTDDLGYDVFARMVYGTQIALMIGFVSVGIAATIGLLVGSCAGYFGGKVDLLLSRVIEIVQSIPSLILILAIVAIIEKPTIWHVMAVLGCTGWVGIARLTRGEFLKLKTLDYVTAARALGFSSPRIIARHMLPNALAPVFVSVSFGIAGAILTESGLSFLGFGVQPPTPSWGAILKSGFEDTTKWWLIVFPGAAVFVAVFTYNLIGDGLQQAIDPRLRGTS